MKLYQSMYDRCHIEFFMKMFLFSSKKKYLLGRNLYTSSLLRKIKVDGVIDDFTSESFFCGTKIFKLESIEQKSLILVMSGGSTLSVIDNLRKSGFENILDYFTFFQNVFYDLPEISFSENFYTEYVKNKQNFDYIYSLLKDDLSKLIFQKLVSFKSTYNVGFLCGFRNMEDKQYFDFLGKYECQYFVDVGAYDGTTTLRFIKKYPQYKGVYLFEPEMNNFMASKRNLSNIPEVNFFKKGCSSHDGFSNISSSSDTSVISLDGDQPIELVALDNILPNKKGLFIKMDIEGAEYDALLGCCETIKKAHPALAISVYHRTNDFWRLPMLILSINSNYDIYMRHYTETVYETVMYFIPKK